jgi:hypothetical protein
VEPDLDVDEPLSGDHASETGEDELAEEPTTGDQPAEPVETSKVGPHRLRCADWFVVYMSELARRPAKPVFTGQHHFDVDR